MKSLSVVVVMFCVFDFTSFLCCWSWSYYVRVSRATMEASPGRPSYYRWTEDQLMRSLPVACEADR
jgi:hypothetical protein